MQTQRERCSAICYHVLVIHMILLYTVNIRRDVFSCERRIPCLIPFCSCLSHQTVLLVSFQPRSGLTGCLNMATVNASASTSGMQHARARDSPGKGECFGSFSDLSRVFDHLHQMLVKSWPQVRRQVSLDLCHPRKRQITEEKREYTGYCYDPTMMLHAEYEVDQDDGFHPEQPARISRIFERLKGVISGNLTYSKAKRNSSKRLHLDAGCIRQMRKVPVRKASRQEILLVHSPDHWERVQQMACKPLFCASSALQSA